MNPHLAHARRSARSTWTRRALLAAALCLSQSLTGCALLWPKSDPPRHSFVCAPEAQERCEFTKLLIPAGEIPADTAGDIATMNRNEGLACRERHDALRKCVDDHMRDD